MLSLRTPSPLPVSVIPGLLLMVPGLLTGQKQEQSDSQQHLHGSHSVRGSAPLQPSLPAASPITWHRGGLAPPLSDTATPLQWHRPPPAAVVPSLPPSPTMVPPAPPPAAVVRSIPRNGARPGPAAAAIARRPFLRRGAAADTERAGTAGPTAPPRLAHGGQPHRLTPPAAYQTLGEPLRVRRAPVSNNLPPPAPPRFPSPPRRRSPARL